MLKFCPDLYLRVGAATQRLVARFSDELKDDVVEDVIIEHLRQLLNVVRNDSQQLGLTLIVEQIDRVFRNFDGPTPTYGKLTPVVEELEIRLFDHFRNETFFHISPADAQYFKTPQLFGPEVADRFPDASKDIEEAGKCLGLERGTACVFHLMRVMEVGLKHLAGLLAIPYAPSWEAYLSQINTKMGLKYRNKTKKWKALEPFMKEAAGDLLTVKIAWRNPTMHVVRHYDPDEAQDVYKAVRAFIRRLALRQAP